MLAEKFARFRKARGAGLPDLCCEPTSRIGVNPATVPFETQAELTYRRIARAIEYLHAHFAEQPDLATLAAVAGMSPFHFQRTFTAWAGISPKQFAQRLTANYLKQHLAEFPNLASAADAVGLGAEARVHELFVRLEAVPPQVYRQGGAGLTLGWGLHDSPFGACLLAATERGITDLHFVPEELTAADAEALLRQRWPQADLQRDQPGTGELVQRVFRADQTTKAGVLTVFVAGSPFQLKVWEALLRIPAGQLTTYQAIAQAIGQPKALQAVGGAVGANPVGYLIPCHRVIRKSGVLGEYRWGAARKLALLGRELP